MRNSKPYKPGFSPGGPDVNVHQHTTASIVYSPVLAIARGFFVIFYVSI
jgi:hypothetical protein